MKNRKQVKAMGGKIENPNTALIRNEIAKANAELEANSNPWVIGLNTVGALGMQYGTSLMNSSGGFEGFGNGANAELDSMTVIPGNTATKLALGGTVGASSVEVEGNEVGQTPNGNLLDFIGPSHEQGGIDTVLPNGTEIYSDRISVGGETMAQRKKRRERIEAKLAKKNTDTLSINALKRVSQKNAKQDTIDRNIQDSVNRLENPEIKAYGGTVGNPWQELLMSLSNSLGTNNIPTSTLTPDNNGSITSANYSPFEEETLDGIVIEAKPKVATQTPSTLAVNSSPAPTTTPSQTQSTASTGMTMPSFILGDLIGVGGNMYRAIEGRNNTNRNRAGDTPNINAFENFGQDALNTIQESMGYVQGMADEARMSTRVAGNTARRSGRNSARGVNTQRALDLATYAKEVDANNNITVNEASQMLQLLGQQAQLENVQDQVVMQGESVRDMNDRRDRDAYYSNLAKNIQTMGEAITQTGNAINNTQERDTSVSLLNQMSQYFDVTQTGQLVPKSQPQNTFQSKVQRENLNLLTEDQISAGDWQNITNLNTGKPFQSEQEYRLYKIAQQALTSGSVNIDKKPVAKKETKKSK